MAVKKPLALIHGMLGRAGTWRGFLNALGPGISPLMIELPGHGLAADWDESRDFADQAVEIALDDLPADPVPLVGHGFGAVLALRLAVERPYRVASLVLIEPLFYAAVEGRWAHDKLKRDLANFDKRMKAAEYATAVKEHHAIWGDGRPWGEQPADQRAYMMERIRLVQGGSSLLWKDPQGLLRPGRLEGIEVPVTFVDGGDSHPIVAEIISTIGDRIADAEWISVPGARHTLPVTHPDKVAEAVAGRLFV